MNEGEVYLNPSGEVVRQEGKNTEEEGFERRETNIWYAKQHHKAVASLISSVIVYGFFGTLQAILKTVFVLLSSLAR